MNEAFAEALNLDDDGRATCGFCDLSCEPEGMEVHKFFGRLLLVCDFCSDVATGKADDRLERRVERKAGPMMSVDEFEEIASTPGVAT
jgi:hypothetical protein